MKKLVFAILALLLLSGCSQPPQPSDATTVPTEPTITTEPIAVNQSFYVENSPIELATGGAVTAYQMDSGVTGLARLGENLLVCVDDRQLYLLSPDTLEVLRTRELECPVRFNQPNLLITEDLFGYYDPGTATFHLLDTNLLTASTIPIQLELAIQPMMTADASTIYYTDANGIRVLDLASGSSRLLRQEHCPVTSLDDLLFDDRVLRYTRTLEDGTSENCFIDSDTGSIYYTADYQGHMTCWGDRFAGVIHLQHPLGDTKRIVTGDLSGDLCMLIPASGWDSILYPDDAAVLVQREKEAALELGLYDLESGLHLAQATLSRFYSGFAYACRIGDYVWLSDGAGSTFYRWDTAMSRSTATSSHLIPYASLSEPDKTGMDTCVSLASEISDAHQVQITFASEANRTDGLDYSGYLDYRPEYYTAALNWLDLFLSRFPENFLYQVGKTTSSGRLQIHLVDDFDPATGQTFGTADCTFTDNNLTLRLSMNADLEYVFYHELFHAMEVRIMNTGDGLNKWADLNPEGFAYANSYAAYQSGALDHSPHLTPGSNYFADAYSLLTGREDRAQIFLYAMMEGQADRFASQPMQTKLALICSQIRSTFGVNPESILPWEQYLIRE